MKFAFLVPLAIALSPVAAHAQEHRFYDTAQFTGLDLKAASPLKFYNADNTHFVSVAPPALSADTSYTLPAADGAAGHCLATDGTGHLSWATCGGLGSAKYDWATADGASVSFTHGFGTSDLVVMVRDVATGAEISVDQDATNPNILQLHSASVPPITGWRVLVIAL